MFTRFHKRFVGTFVSFSLVILTDLSMSVQLHSKSITVLLKINVCVGVYAFRSLQLC